MAQYKQCKNLQNGMRTSNYDKKENQNNIKTKIKAIRIQIPIAFISVTIISIVKHCFELHKLCFP